jgi:hypothetical protein
MDPSFRHTKYIKMTRHRNKHVDGTPIFISGKNRLHTYHSRFIPEEVAAVFQIVVRDAHVLLKLLNYEEYCRRDKW